MKKTIILLAAVFAISFGSCSGSSKEGEKNEGNAGEKTEANAAQGVDGAFDAVQQSASPEEVAKKIKPILEKGDIEKLPVTDQCKLLISYYYVGYYESEKSPLFSELDKTKGGRELEMLESGLARNPNATAFFKSLTGQAAHLYNLLINDDDVDDQNYGRYDSGDDGDEGYNADDRYYDRYDSGDDGDDGYDWD